MTNIQFQSGAIDAGGCVSQAWEMIKQRYWMYIGIAFLGFIMANYLYCISWVLLGPVMAGIYLVVLRDLRGEPVDFGMMFKGFEKFVPLMVVGLLQSIPTIIGQILGFALNIGQIFMTGMGGSRNPNFFAGGDPNFALAGSVLIIILVVSLVFIIFAVVWRAVFFCAIPLVLEHDMSPMDAMKLSARAGFANFGGIFLLGILEGLIMILGVLLICFGLIFISLPIMFVANAIAYRQIFPWTGQQQFNMTPPPPTAYGNFGNGM